jgi:hypothetical protein
MMKKYLSFLILLVTAIACQTVVDFDIPVDRPKIVVNSLFSPDSVWRIQISRSQHILDSRQGSSFDPVSDAVVTIHDQNNLLIETITGSYEDFIGYSYKGKTKPLPGESYIVKVDVKNETSMEAFNKVPTYVPITSVEIDSSLFISAGEAIEMDINFKDPANEKNYYEIKILQEAISYISNGDTIWRTQEIYYEVGDASFDNEFSGSQKFITDNLFNGKNYSFHLKLHGYGGSWYAKNSRVVLFNVSEEYYKYFTTKNLQDYTNGDPFAQPVQVYTNVENGLGIFAGYSASVVELK